MELLYRLKSAFDSLPRVVKTGLPFICFMCGGSLVLAEFAKLRYEFRQSKPLDAAELEARGIKMKPPKSIDEVYEEIKEIDIDNWENIRGPRPHEDGNEKLIEAIKAKARAERQRVMEAKMKRIRDA